MALLKDYDWDLFRTYGLFLLWERIMDSMASSEKAGIGTQKWRAGPGGGIGRMIRRIGRYAG